MSFLSTKNVETTDKVFISSYATYGINKLRIVSIDVTNSNPGKYKIVFHMEGTPITKEGFKPVEGAIGKVCNVSLFLDVNDEKSITNVSTTIGTIADKLNVREQVDAIASGDPVDYFAQLSKLVSGFNYLWFVLSAREYAPGKYGLNFPKYKWCKSPAEVDEESVVYTVINGDSIATSVNLIGGGALIFNPNDQWHLKKFVEPAPDVDNMPFGKPANAVPSFLPKV